MKLSDRRVFALSVITALSLFFGASAIFRVTAQQPACPTIVGAACGRKAILHSQCERR